ncbi:long-chain fatty acid--CoA ligase [Rhodococcus olei]|uniref:Long-chain fatty acid--CoA ligase n=1 Tax=Rhodococcus olei TaxID=2161675 RepID=A0ABP8PUS5_9NOCA
MPTIGGSVVHNAHRVPDRDAVVFGARRWSWRELDSEVAQTAAVLDSMRLGHGDRFALIAANTPEFVIAAFAALRLGGIVVPVNARLAIPEIRHILSDSGATIVASGPDYADKVEAALDTHVLAGTRGVSLGPGSSLPDLFAAQTGIPPITEDRASESDDAFIVYTSGTTGSPKGVLLDHHRAVWAALAQVVSLGLRDGIRYLHLPPLYHSGGVVFLNATTLVGGTNILIPAFDPMTVLDTIQSESVNALLGVPTMYEFLLRHPQISQYDTSSWRTGVFGAAPMPESTIRKLIDTFPTVEFFQQCGQTEAGPTGLYSTMEQVRAQPFSSGHQAQPFVEARLVDRSGADAGTGEIGELHLRGEPVMKGYWGRPEETNETLHNGWLGTGDLLELAPDGSMRLVDRAKDVIISGGRNIYSAEVEQVLREHPDVADCAVIGRDEPDWGEMVVAVVTPIDGRPLTLDSIRQHCSAFIADYKLPRDLVIGAIPRNAAGKIQKHLLRAR